MGRLCPAVRLIDDPVSVFRAENKLAQLEAATALGLAVPDTLVSNDPDEIRRFAAGRNVVLKSPRHLPEMGLKTIRATPRVLADGARLRACPTIVQAEVAGQVHWRILVFGERALGCRLVTPRLDWRGGGAVAGTPLDVPAETLVQMRALLAAFGLSMAVFDYKLQGDQPMFLEFNPQGQFLFLAALDGRETWVDAFAEFLVGDM